MLIAVTRRIKTNKGRRTMSQEALQVLYNLDASVRRKLEQKKQDPFFSGKRMEGYEQAMLAVLSMIHNEKERARR